MPRVTLHRSKSYASRRFVSKFWAECVYEQIDMKNRNTIATLYGDFYGIMDWIAPWYEIARLTYESVTFKLMNGSLNMMCLLHNTW